jgi:peptide/nickel transport system permease protein
VSTFGELGEAGTRYSGSRTAQELLVEEEFVPEERFESKIIEARGPWKLAWDRLRHDRVAIGSFIVIVLIACMAIFAPLASALTGHGMDAQYRMTGLSPAGIPVGPRWHFPWGADEEGRDLLVRVFYGARISLLVGVTSAALAVAGGVVLGMLAGFFGGLVDTIMARVFDVVLAMPYLVFALALVAAIGGQGGVLIDIAVISFFSFGAVARIVRGQVLSIKEKEYIEAAHSLGAGSLRVMFVDIFPNLLAPVIVYFSLLVPASIVFEATLAFLGLGTPPPTPDWGSMLQEAINWYNPAWWYVVFPGGALLVTTLAFNLLGDSVRDAFDPRYNRIFASEAS